MQLAHIAIPGINSRKPSVEGKSVVFEMIPSLKVGQNTHGIVSLSDGLDYLFCNIITRNQLVKLKEVGLMALPFSFFGNRNMGRKLDITRAWSSRR